MEDKLEKIAKEYGWMFKFKDEDLDYLQNSSDLYDCICSERRVAFMMGAMWRMNNMWTSVEEGFPEVNISVFIITKNGNIAISKMYIPKDCKGNILGGKQWNGSASFKDSVIAWMYKPKLNK